MCDDTTATTTPQRLAAGLADALAGQDPAALRAGELADTLASLHRELQRVQAQQLRYLAVFDARGDAPVVAGLSSTASWLRHACRMESREATHQVHLARALREMPHTWAAFADGAIGLKHAAVIYQASHKIGLDRVQENEPALIEAAQQVRPDELRRLTTHLHHALEPQTIVEATHKQRARRWLGVSTTFEGMVAVDGMLDPESGAAVLEAINAHSAPRTGGDERTPAQRRADALTGLCRRALDSGELPASGGQRPHLTVTVSWETLTGRPGSPAAHLSRVGPVPGETARRLGCDGSLTRIITGDTHGSGGTGDTDGTGDGGHGERAGPASEATARDRLRASFGAALAADPALTQLLAGSSQVLDVGRKTRIVPPGLRAAVVRRDGHCVFPGCDKPPDWCDCHHIRHWSDGGPTTFANLVLLCGEHHEAVHEGGWRMTKRPGGKLSFTPPDARPGADPPEQQQTA